MTKKNLILFGFIIAKIILQYFLISPEYDLHRDEFLHLDQARHLAWGYLSVPPVTSWISYVVLILGNSVFWVKFFPALFGALTILVVWKTVEELKGNLFALILSAVSILFSVILRINILYQPNSLDILVWTIVFFLIVKYINSENPKWLYFLSLAFAIGFLNKYNIIFLLLGLLPALLLTEQRKLFQNKHFYYSLIIALIVVSPNLIWQYKNNFPVFYHLNELAKIQLENVNRIDFLKEQLMFFAGSILVIIAAFVSFFRNKGFQKYQIVFWSFLFTMLIFVYFKAKAYYAIGLYPILIAFGAVYLGRLLQGKWKMYLRPIVILIPIILFVPLIKVIFPVNSPQAIQQNIKSFQNLGLLRWEDGKDHNLPQDFADMLGWREMAQKVDSALRTLSNEENTLILCDNYGQAGALNYYSKNKNIQAVSFNADYINWFPLDKQINNMILVKEATDTDKNRDEEKAEFETITEFAKINNTFAREYGTTIYILKHANFDINKQIKVELERKKNNF